MFGAVMTAPWWAAALLIAAYGAWAVWGLRQRGRAIIAIQVGIVAALEVLLLLVWAIWST